MSSPWPAPPPAPQPDGPHPTVVTVTPTIMSGTVVRWYPNEAAEASHGPHVSASRDAVMIHGTLTFPPDDDGWFRAALAAAHDAYQTLLADPKADMSHLATHRRRLFDRELTPIVREGAGDHA